MIRLCDHQLGVGDCLELMNEIPDNSVDLVLADPPFGTTQCKWDSIIDLNSMWEQLTRITKDKTPILLFAQTPFDKVLGCSNLRDLRYEWIWHKTAATGHLNAKKMPMKAHENILVFYRKLPSYTPQKTVGHPLKKSATGKVCISDVYGKEDIKPNYESTTRYPRSVQTFKSDKQTLNLHPTQKPVALLKYMVETYSCVGDVVLDFCMGSGSTGVPCIELDRKFIGIEITRKHYNQSFFRLMTHIMKRIK